MVLNVADHDLVAALCRICEPIAFMSIFPYIYYMISTFHITSDDRQIALYAGMVTSAFAFAEFSASIAWGRLSDKIGRKPVLIGGLVGFGRAGIGRTIERVRPILSVWYRLGAKTLMVVVSNIGVLQTTVAELVSVKEHQRTWELAYFQ